MAQQVKALTLTPGMLHSISWTHKNVGGDPVYQAFHCLHHMCHGTHMPLPCYVHTHIHHNKNKYKNSQRSQFEFHLVSSRTLLEIVIIGLFRTTLGRGTDSEFYSCEWKYWGQVESPEILVRDSQKWTWKIWWERQGANTRSLRWHCCDLMQPSQPLISNLSHQKLGISGRFPAPQQNT